jgi:predicted amidophosphoribosyltransferase
MTGGGYRAGPINQLIANLKCPPSIAELDLPRARHKERAIASVAACLRDAVSRSWAESVTWIPVPPSRARRDLDYDDRLTRVLRLAFARYDTDVRTALYQSESFVADHARLRRTGLDSLYECLRINWDALLSRPLRDGVVVFDDVLTTGKHYKCCERRLRQALPDIRISGLFVARRVLSGRGRRLP